MSAAAHHHESGRSRQPITIVSTEQGPRVGPYIFGKTLGTGSTGKVKLAKNLATGDIVAIKIVRKDYLDNKPSLKKKMRREISVLKVLSHPNLLSLIDVFEIETHLFLVMEFVDGLELFEFLVRRGALPIPQALNFFQQIVCGLEYCHHRLICHRDLKPENLLLDRNLNIKIADFGMTSLNPPGSLLETSCGSPHYCDPMVVSGEMYDGLKADIWSCGVILYAMVTGRLPFDDDNIQRLLQKVQMGQYHLPSDLPKDLRDLIRRMLTVDPDQRITLEGIKAHPWFNSIPPRNYTEDHFVAPHEPIHDPDPMIMRGLVDLGWGDAGAIATELQKEGPSMEKVFYQQLERHPMYRRNVPRNRLDVHPDARREPPRRRPTEQPAARVEAPNGDNRRRPVPDDHEVVRERLESLAVGNGTAEPPVSASTKEEDEKKPHPPSAPQSSETAADEQRSKNEDDPSNSGSGASLVRQSSLRHGIAEIAAKPPTDDRVEEAIQTASNQKSWFDSMRSMWTGHPEGQQDPKAKKDANTVEKKASQ